MTLVEASPTISKLHDDSLLRALVGQGIHLCSGPPRRTRRPARPAACGKGSRANAARSYRLRLGQHLVAELWGRSVGVNNSTRMPSKDSEFILQSTKVEQRGARQSVHQQIQITALSIRSLDHGAKHARVGRPIPACSPRTADRFKSSAMDGRMVWRSSQKGIEDAGMICNRRGQELQTAWLRCNALRLTLVGWNVASKADIKALGLGRVIRPVVAHVHVQRYAAQLGPRARRGGTRPAG